jgi:hypothetical protein
MAGGLFKGRKERVGWRNFISYGDGAGMKVLRLFGDLGRYDAGVENGSRVLRGQGKSTIYKRRSNSYSLNGMGPQRKKYEPVGGFLCDSADHEG